MLSLVTGGTGFVGASLVRALVKRGDRVRVIGRRAAIQWRREPMVEHIRADLLEGEVIESAVAGVDRVFHLAAATGGSWDEYERVTIGGSIRLLRAIGRSKAKRVVYVSSLSVYDNNVFSDGKVIDENAPLQNEEGARSYYARAKCRAERLMREYMETKQVPLTIVRPGVVFGPDMANPLTGVAMSVGGVCWVLTGHPEKLLPAIYIDDLMEAFILVAERPEALGRTFNLLNAEMPSHREVVALYRRSSGDRRKMIRLPLKSAVPFLKVLDWTVKRVTGREWQTARVAMKLTSRVVYSGRRAQEELGFVAKTPFGCGLATVVRPQY